MATFVRDGDFSWAFPDKAVEYMRAAIVTAIRTEMLIHPGPSIDLFLSPKDAIDVERSASPAAVGDVPW